MIAKFQIILEGVTPLKIQCLETFSDEKLKKEKQCYVNRAYKEIYDNCFKNYKLNNLIIFENVNKRIWQNST